MVQVPETPIWLLFKNRTNDAIRSLQWLRGWVPSAMVMDEFMSLQKYKVSVQSCYECETLQRTCTHGAPTFCEKMKDFVRRPTVLPFILLTFIFFNTQFCGLFAMRPYIAKILIVYRSPVEPKVVIVWLGALSILGNVILMVIIRACGKRPIALISMGITFISCFVLGKRMQHIISAETKFIRIMNLVCVARCIRFHFPTHRNHFILLDPNWRYQPNVHEHKSSFIHSIDEYLCAAVCNKFRSGYAKYVDVWNISVQVSDYRR